MLKDLIDQLCKLRNLTSAQVSLAVAELVSETVSTELKADFLSALTRKGETPEEIKAFVLDLRDRAVQPRVDDVLRRGVVLDVVGTGGDRLSTFNISTTVAIIAASAGICVAKHGNRASTSLVGSADVIEGLGIPVDRSPEDTVASMQATGFGFFFAPRYHPAFRHIVPARKLCAARGEPTIFNFLGPLLNPVKPSAMLLGVARPDLCQPLAQVLQSIGVHRAMVVCGTVPVDGGTRHLDEISPLGPTHVAEFYQERAMSYSALDPSLFPMQPASLSDLRGGDREVNVGIIHRVLQGEERGPKRDAVLINAAAALFVAQKACNLAEGWDLAARLIDNGIAWRKLQETATGTVGS